MRNFFHFPGDLMENQCCLCEAVLDAKKSKGQSKLENTLLLGAKNFVVLPALGPLEAGHVIVVSRSHYPNIASLGKQAIHEYTKLSRNLALKKPFKYEGFLEFENGATENECAGACVSHAHVHWIPGLSKYDTILEGLLPKLPDITNLLDLTDSNIPYIQIKRKGGPRRFYLARNVAPQLMRQLLCERIGRKDWNWIDNLRFDCVEKTIIFWKEIAP